MFDVAVRRKRLELKIEQQGDRRDTARRQEPPTVLVAAQHLPSLFVLVPVDHCQPTLSLSSCVLDRCPSVRRGGDCVAQLLHPRRGTLGKISSGVHVSRSQRRRTAGSDGS
eukprot:COSAG02_NODE_10933_length_1829_cov_9.120231_3_plen_111_part_00